MGVNALRIFLAVLLHGLAHWLYTLQWIPEAEFGQVWRLAASGFLGLSIGDLALFYAFLEIGPRLATLVMTTAPIFAALFGAVSLGEALPVTGWVGMGMTLGGVAWVVSERQGSQSSVDVAASGERAFGLGRRFRGIGLALIAAGCQSGGLLLSKQGMGHGWLPEHEHLAPQTATLIRMTFAALGMIPILVLRSFTRNARPREASSPMDRRQLLIGCALAAGGAVTGPFLGVWMSLVASDRVPIGIAQTLCSFTPILILPFAVRVHGERIGPRAILGAALAVMGIAVLFGGTA